MLRWLKKHWLGAILGGIVGVLATGFLIAFYAFFVEPTWVAIRTVSLASSPTLRILHIADIHHKGDRAYLERVVARLNELPADIVCFTGDLVEDVEYLGEALDVLSKLQKPLYGVGGNHDYWELDARERLHRAFADTGGAWLRDERILSPDGRVEIVGSTGRANTFPARSGAGAPKTILLVHDPATADRLQKERFGVILSGHTHGGQVRIPGLGPVVRPPPIGEYDRGLFETVAGPLYVNPGIGTYHLKVRFCCRPEITVIEL